MKRSSLYAAAKTFRTTGDWSPVDSSVNDIIGLSSPSVRARVRQLIRDFPYFSRASRIMTDYTVGTGITFQSRAKGQDGKTNAQAVQKIEDAFHWWADEADIAGKLHFYEMQQLAKRQDTECGEFLIVKTIDRSPGRYIPYCLQMYEADWLTDQGAKIKKGNAISQGIEYNKQTGRVIALHLTDPDSWGKTKRVMAEDVIHGFETLRPGQLRGISPFVTGVLVTHDLQDLMDSEIDTGKMASKWLAFVYTDNPKTRQIGATTDNDGKKIEVIENSIIEYLRPGEKIELAANPRPSQNFPPFVRLVLGMISVATGVPYELLSGDYAGLSFATMRISRGDFAAQLQPIAARHVRHMCQPAILPFFDWAVLSGKLDLPGYYTGNNARMYQKNVWQPPALEEVDPLRKAKADEAEMSRNLRSPQESVARRGRDLEDVYSEIAAAREMRDRYGLEDGEVNTAMKNNPAAIDEQKTGDDKK